MPRDIALTPRECARLWAWATMQGHDTFRRKLMTTPLAAVDEFAQHANDPANQANGWKPFPNPNDRKLVDIDITDTSYEFDEIEDEQDFDPIMDGSSGINLKPHLWKRP